MQLANQKEETRIHPTGEDLIIKAMVSQHWVAIGDEEGQIVMASAGRRIKDGMLFGVTVSIAGRECIALIDSGASHNRIWHLQ